jgi:hypothetical protein
MAWMWALRKVPWKTIIRHAAEPALFADLAKQVEEMATALDVLRARLLLALWGAGVALVIAVVTVILVWRRG